MKSLSAQLQHGWQVITHCKKHYQPQPGNFRKFCCISWTFETCATLSSEFRQSIPTPRTRPIQSMTFGWFLWYNIIYIYIILHGCYGTWFKLLSCSFPTTSTTQDSEGDEGSVITSSKKPSKSCFRPSKSGCLGFCGVRGKGLRFVKVNFQVYKNINYANYTVLQEYSTSYLSLKSR